MAKRIKQTKAPLELANTIQVDTAEGSAVYNVNAKYSEKATEVSNPLTIKEVKMTNTSSVEFTGKDPVTIEVVPASGGQFKGPITVPSHTSEEATDDAVLNNREIREIVSQLTGASYYTWSEESGLVEVYKADGEYLRIGIVVGNITDLPSFNSYNYSTKTLPFYLYVGQVFDDSNKNVLFGRLFFGTTEDYDKDDDLIPQPVPFITDRADIAHQLVYNNSYITASEIIEDIHVLRTDIVEGNIKAARADKADSAAVADYAEVSGNATQLRTARGIRTDLGSEAIVLFNGTSGISPGVTGTLSIRHGGTGATTATGALTNLGLNTVVTGSGKNLNDYTSIGITYFANGSAPRNIPDGVNNGWLIVLAGSSNMVKQLFFRAGTVNSNSFHTFERIRDGDNNWSSWKRIDVLAEHSHNVSNITGVLPVAKGGTGQTDLANVTVGNATKATNATNATNATKATKDGNGNTIASYYQKKITISPNAPNNNQGNDGDIWITY